VSKIFRVMVEASYSKKTECQCFMLTSLEKDWEFQGSLLSLELVGFKIHQTLPKRECLGCYGLFNRDVVMVEGGGGNEAETR
jgi:hypothetical protein